MKTREDIIARIRKLLALAGDNPNVAEATAAALKAQALIAEFDVEKFELYDEQNEEIVEVESVRYKGESWAWYLASAIADNFRCRIYRWSWTGAGHVVKFVGYDADAEAAALVFDRLFTLGKRLADREAREARKLYGTARGVKGAFLIGDGTGGFVGGIRRELEKQCQALMLVVPKSVNEYMETEHSDLRSFSVRASTNMDRITSEHGFNAGRDAVRSARIGEQKKIGA